jgi:hypothetical protein
VKHVKEGKTLIRSSKLAIAVVLVALFWDQSCMGPPISAECKSFYSLSAGERERLFKTYDLEKQLDLYRCGMNRRPPDIALAIPIADRGESTIPVLLEKLEREKDEQFQYVIIDVFEVMSVKGYLRNKSEVITRIRQVVTKMRISILRDMALKDLEQIERNSAP